MYIETQGWSLAVDHIYRDDGYSGATLTRPGLDRLRDAARSHELDRVVLTTPDRLARNYVQQMVLLDEFTHAGCQVEFLDRPMSQDPHDQLLLQIRGAVAEYERTLITERMRRGRLTKLRAGLLLPWTRPPYGYRLHPDRPRDPSGVTVDAAEAAVVAELFATYLQPDATLASLAKALQRRKLPTPLRKGGWTSPTIRGILRNPTYTGTVYAQRTRYRAAQVRRSATHPIGHPHGTATLLPREAWIVVGNVPALVTHEQFEQVQAKLTQNQSFACRNNTAHQYLLRALVSCGHCRLACTARTENARNGYYVCNGKGQSVHSHRDTPCPARYIPAHQLDTLVWQDVCTVLQHPELIQNALHRAQCGAWLPQELHARRNNLRKGRASLQQQLERLTDAYVRGVIPLDEYERRRADLEHKDRALTEQLQELDGEADRHHELTGLVTSIDAFCQRIGSSLATTTFEQKRQLVMLLIDRVIVIDGDIEIRYVVPLSPESEHVRFSHLRKDYFHHPATRQHHEPSLICQFRAHFQRNAVLVLHVDDQVTGIALIGPDLV
jgi:site-specific DNA recombinase